MFVVVVCLWCFPLGVFVCMLACVFCVCACFVGVPCYVCLFLCLCVFVFVVGVASNVCVLCVLFVFPLIDA